MFRASLILFYILIASSSYSAVFTVTNTDDSGTGSFRQIISEANNLAGHDTIQFSSSIDGSPIILTSGLIYLSDGVSVLGNGEEKTFIESSQDILKIQYTITTEDYLFSGITFTNFDVAINGDTQITPINLTVVHCSFTQNGLMSGTAIDLRTSELLKVRKCNFESIGGAVESYFCGNLMFTDNQVIDCAMGLYIYNMPNNGELQVLRNSHVNNTFAMRLNAIETGFVANNTIYGSTETALRITEDSGTSGLHIMNNTIVNNGVGIEIDEDSDASSLLIQNNILWNNTDEDLKILADITMSGGNPSLTNNIGISASSDYGIPTFDFSSDPLLDANGPIDHGGATFTISIDANSPAINNGLQYDAPEVDQRGYLRDEDIDIGAFEYNGIDLSVTSNMVAEPNMLIYPNPATSFIQIVNLKNVQNYAIHSANGEQILKGQVSEEKRIDIRNLSKGKYILRLENGNHLGFIRK